MKKTIFFLHFILTAAFIFCFSTTEAKVPQRNTKAAFHNGQRKANRPANRAVAPRAVRHQAKQAQRNTKAAFQNAQHKAHRPANRPVAQKAVRLQANQVQRTTQKVHQVGNQAFLQQAKISPSAIKHIQDRHWYNANSGPTTSHFHKNMTIQKLQGIATRTINHGTQRPSTHGQGRLTHQYTFNRPVGTGSNGQQTTKVRVVTDGQNNVITAFPVN